MCVMQETIQDGTGCWENLEGFFAEALVAKGQTIAVVVVAATAVEALRDDEILSVRAIAV